ncbi:MAG: S8 family serine peptidase, partial [Paracoccaceae bacterium]
MAGPASSASLEIPPGDAPVETPGAAPSAPPGAAVAHARADANADRIEDAVGARRAAAQAGERFDVIVLFDGSDAVGRGRAAAGPFAVSREFSVINGFQAQLTAPQIRGLSRAHGLFRISGNGVVQTQDIPSNDDMGVTDARFDFGLDGSGVTVCPIDTGIDPNHELFDTKGPGSVPLGPAEFFDAVNGNAFPYDDHGHGSHVAGIATGDGDGAPGFAADAIGVAPGASLVVAKALDANGNGTDAQVLAGIDYCAGRPDVDIVSMSLGG